MVMGDVDSQQTACNAIAARLQLWQTVFSGHSPSSASHHSVASMSPSFMDVPRLTTVPISVPGALNNSVASAGTGTGPLVGITLLIYSATSNLFDLSILDRGGEDSTTDKELKFVGFLNELCLQANCLVQLLPVSLVPLSKRHDLRRVTIIAPSVQVLLDVLAVIHKLIAVYVPYDGTCRYPVSSNYFHCRCIQCV
jgi:hypothetical protein